MGATSYDATRLDDLLAQERALFAERSRRRSTPGRPHLFGQVPMAWMHKNVVGVRLLVGRRAATGAGTSTGHQYIDFALGDTGARGGHSLQPTLDPVAHLKCDLGGVTTRLPTVDGEWVGADLTRRFGLSRWSFTLTAADANRWAIRLVRALTGRPQILVNDYCCHGSGGLLLTSFHNMALMSPVTTRADVERHHEVFDEVLADLSVLTPTAEEIA